MNKLLRRFIPSLNEHLSDDRLASLFCGELVFVERWIARQHLATCWQCRLRQEELEGIRSDRMFDHCRDVLTVNQVPKEPEAEFARKLRLQIQTGTPRKSKVPRRPNISFPELSPMNPALVVCMVFGFATILSFYFWWQQRAPRISSNALLVRAEKWDMPAPQGVVYQAVRITMTKESKKETISRSIYRDIQGKRQPKRVKLNDTEEQVRSALTETGLDWNEPLSASGYQSWHDRQHVREDHIARAGVHLLRLTTTVPEGPVSEQSLTVRDTDFHPVQRTLALRDSSTVEIAEVDFKILPWNAVDANAFEPLSDTPSIATFPARVLPFPRLPEIATQEQLDEAELGARLMLNQLHADTGEPLSIHRTAQDVVVDGLVDTEERKRALQVALNTVPRVTVSIQSVEDIKNRPDAGGFPTSVSVASMPDQPSPLATYLAGRGRSISDVNDLAQRIFTNAWTITQESKEIVDLQTRFGSDEPKTILASATLSELIYSHRERLEAALKHERELLVETQTASSVSSNPSASRTSSLLDLASKNLALSKELTQTSAPATRSAEQILAEMSITMNDLTTTAQDINGKSQSNSALSGKK
jgi:hypothetical protein